MKTSLQAVSKRICLRAHTTQPSVLAATRYNSTFPAISSPPPQKEYVSSKATFYDLFPSTLPSGPPPAGSFAFNPRTLRSEFLKKQQSTHPDLFPPSQRSRAEANSSHLNKAYTTLLDPLLRAQYLLGLRGIDVEDETAKLAEEDQGLLMEVMEVREEIEEIQEEEHLEELQRMNDERLERSVTALGEAFKVDDLESARKEAVRLRYWVNIRDSLRAWEKGKVVVLQH